MSASSWTPLSYGFDPIREFIQAELVERVLPSLAVAVSHQGKIVWAEGFGWADREKRIPATAHTLYSLASISKPITATGLMVLRDEVFHPLGMNRSSVGIGPGLESYTAARYRGGTERLPFYDFDHPGGSAVYASAHDLVRFGRFHLKSRLPDQKAILADAALDEMHQPTVVTGANDGYGVGWGIRDASSERHRIGHSGGMDGVSTILELVPSEQLAVAVLANAVSDLPQRVLEKVYPVLRPGHVAAPRPAPDLAKDEARFESTPELRGTWSGLVSTHAADLPPELTFYADGDVHARLGRQLKTLLTDVRLKDGWLTGRMLGDVGTPDANRRPYLLHADLKLRGEVLNGALIAISLPEMRFGNALSYWTQLRRSEASV